MRLAPVNQDEYWMRLALEQAEQAFAAGEVPIGAVLVREGELIAAAYNRTLSDCDPSAHSEILVLRAAAKRTGNHRLGGARLYVSVEPCIMCMGVLIQARVAALIFGAYNDKGGACGSAFDLSREPALNHHLHEVKGGVLADESRALMQRFFAAKRGKG